MRKPSPRYFFLTILLASTVLAQVETAQDPRRNEVYSYDIDAISFSSTGSARSRVDVFVRVPYEQLGFVQSENMYLASYEITVGIYDSSGRLYTEKVWTEQVKTSSFEESVSPESYSLTQQIFEVVPGKYSLITIVRDAEIKNPRRFSREIEVPDLSSPSFALSGLMLVSRLSLQDEKKIIVPNVSPNVGLLPEGFYVFFEAYNRESLDSVRIVAEILDERGQSVSREESLHRVASGRNQMFLKIDNSRLSMGDYVLHVHAYRVEQPLTGKSLATTARAFVVRWHGMPLNLKDLDAAIQQLQYIASSTEMERMQESLTEVEKRRLFIEFWTKKDPNPNTPRNEEMESYYAKVEYANKHFRHYIEGWRTDMGMVYIIFGAPNNVDRHPFDIDAKPYEVWSYYDLNHQFVFVDETGFGDYRLTTPIWEIWQRPR